MRSSLKAARWRVPSRVRRGPGVWRRRFHLGSAKGWKVTSYKLPTYVSVTCASVPTAAFAWYWHHSSVVPFTGRRCYVTMSASEEEALGKVVFESIKLQHRDTLLPPSHPTSQAVQRVGRRLVKHSGLPHLQQLDWEFIVIDSHETNAFALPGGCVAVYTGFLPICEDEHGLATVLAHEIGHVVARHSAERISWGRFTQPVWYLIGQLYGDSYHFVSSVFSFVALNLPWSRMQESEADHIGIMLMSRACYDPSFAPRMWTRMQRMRETSGTSASFVYLSTHPSHENRRERLEAAVSEASALRDQACEPQLTEGLVRWRPVEHVSALHGDDGESARWK